MSSFKKLLFYIKHNPRQIFISFICRISFMFSDEIYLKLLYYISTGSHLNLKNPQTFGEKIQWLKLYNRKPEYTQMVDKYEVKKYVADKIGEEYIIPTLGVWNRVEDIDFESLPNQFVLKCTHDSGGIVICKDKNKLNIEDTKKLLRKTLKKNYYLQNREFPYKNVVPRIIAEQYMVDESGYELKDYKVFCFGGVAKYCQVVEGRGSIMTADFYDRNWEHMPFHQPQKYPFASHLHNKPSCLSLLWNFAETLSNDIPFVRADFYIINNHIYFGELTFFPASGTGGIYPKDWDYTFGSWIELSVKDYNKN